MVGVGLEPGEPCGVTKDKDDGAEGAVVTAIPLLELSPPLQEEKRIKAQTRGGDFQPQELNAKTRPNDRI